MSFGAAVPVEFHADPVLCVLEYSLLVWLINEMSSK